MRNVFLFAAKTNLSHDNLESSNFRLSSGDHWWLLYIRPWIRITPYLVGILGGWLLWGHGKTLRDHVQRLSEVSSRNLLILFSATINITIHCHNQRHGM